MEINEMRKDYEEKRFKSGKVVPAFFEINYLVENRRIAYYNSKDDVLYINTNLLDNHNMKLPYSERIKGQQYEHELAKLLSEHKQVSEYLGM